jgi:hypothetical protein
MHNRSVRALWGHGLRRSRASWVQAYFAIIACLLIHLWTCGKPTLRTFRDDLPVPPGLGHAGGADRACGDAQGQVAGPAGPELRGASEIMTC